MGPLALPGRLIGELIFPLGLFFEKADVYHATNHLALRAAIISRKKPLVVTLHDALPFQRVQYTSQLRWRYIRMCYRHAIRADRIIVTSNYSKNRLMEALGIPDEKFALIPLGVNVAWYHPPIKRTEKEGVNVLFVGGSWALARGALTVVWCMKEIQRYYRRFMLTIAGKVSSGDIARIKALAAKYSVLDRIRFTGRLTEEQMRSVFWESDLLVYPSYMGMSYTLLQAAACGLPIITIKGVETSEYLADSAVLVGSESRLPSAILEVLTDPKRRKELSEKARSRACKFSITAMVEKTARIYDSMI
jgi:glycosyltransferase involved in cell wall biosynthesis